MSSTTRSIAMVAALCLGVADVVVLNLYLAPEVLGGELVAAPDDHTPTSGVPATTGPTTLTPATTAAPATIPMTRAVDAAPAAPAADAGVSPDAAPADAGARPDAPLPAVDAAASIEPAGDFKPAMYDLRFSQDRATLKSYHHGSLDQAVDLLTRHPESVAVIEGYADASETQYPTNALIKRRVGKVQKYLEAHAVAGERIRTVNHGAATGADSSEVEHNRRVRLRVELP